MEFGRWEMDNGRGGMSANPSPQGTSALSPMPPPLALPPDHAAAADPRADMFLADSFLAPALSGEHGGVGVNQAQTAHSHGSSQRGTSSSNGSNGSDENDEGEENAEEESGPATRTSPGKRSSALLGRALGPAAHAPDVYQLQLTNKYADLESLYNLPDLLTRYRWVKCVREDCTWAWPVQRFVNASPIQRTNNRKMVQKHRREGCPAGVSSTARADARAAAVAAAGAASAEAAVSTTQSVPARKRQRMDHSCLPVHEQQVLLAFPPGTATATLAQHASNALELDLALASPLPGAAGGGPGAVAQEAGGHDAAAALNAAAAAAVAGGSDADATRMGGGQSNDDAILQHLPSRFFHLGGLPKDAPELQAEQRLVDALLARARLPADTGLRSDPSNNNVLTGWAHVTSDRTVQKKHVQARRIFVKDDARWRVFIAELYFHLVLNQQRPHPSILPIYGVYMTHSGRCEHPDQWYKVGPFVEYGSLSQWRSHAQPLEAAGQEGRLAYQRRVARIALRIAEGMQFLHDKGYFTHLFMGNVLMDSNDQVQLSSNEGFVHLDAVLTADMKWGSDLLPSGPQCPEWHDQTPFTSSAPPRVRRTEMLEPRNVFEFGMILNLALHPTKSAEDVKAEVLRTYLSREDARAGEQARRARVAQTRRECYLRGEALIDDDSASEGPYIRALNAGVRPDTSDVDQTLATLMERCWTVLPVHVTEHGAKRPSWTDIIRVLRAYVEPPAASVSAAVT